MASLLKIGNTWPAQVRRKGHKSITETFPMKAQAVAWTRKVEAEMDARRFNDTRGLANLTLKELIDWYFGEIGAAHPFGKYKTAVLRTWQRNHGDTSVADISSNYLAALVRERLSTSIKTPTGQQSNTGRTLSLANGRVRPRAVL